MLVFLSADVATSRVYGGAALWPPVVDRDVEIEWRRTVASAAAAGDGDGERLSTDASACSCTSTSTVSRRHHRRSASQRQSR